jgi:hypothetical protein
VNTPSACCSGFCPALGDDVCDAGEPVDPMQQATRGEQIRNCRCGVS